MGAINGSSIELVTSVLQLAPKVIDPLADLLPSRCAAWVRHARKFVVTAAGVTLSVVAALGGFPLPPDISTWVAIASAAGTAVMTYWTPNETRET